MKADLYTSSVTVFNNGLTGLAAVLRKAVAHAEANGLDQTDMLKACLYPDMFPLYRQVQIVCDYGRQAPSRVAGLGVPETLTGEPNFDELQSEIAKTKRSLSDFTPDQFVGRDELPLTFPVGGEPMTLPTAQYLLGFATQNFFFHFVTAYAILRHLGVELGKRDYFGR